jgi:tetratricopeptide (TPR) repeat protein
MIGPLAVLAGQGAVAIVREVRSRYGKGLLRSGAIVAVAVALGTLPGPFCQEEMNLEPELYWTVGYCHAQRGESAPALAAYEKALSLKPDYPDVYQSMGELYAADGRHADAARAYRRAVSMAPRDFKSWLGLANSLLELGRREEGIAALRRYVALEPRDVEQRRRLEKLMAP